MYLEWTKRNTVISDGGNSYSPKVIHKNKYIYVAYITDSAIIDSTNKGSTDVVIMKMSVSGNIIWEKQYDNLNTTGAETYIDICIDDNENIYGCYVTTGNTFGYSSNTGGKDVVIFKIDKNSNLIWVDQTHNTSGNEEMPSIGCDNENIYIVYTTDDLMSGEYNTNASDPFKKDIVVLSMTFNQEVNWCRQYQSFNTNINDIYPSVIIGENDIYITYISCENIESEYGKLIVFCLSKDGTVGWRIRGNDIGLENILNIKPSITIDSDENVYLSCSMDVSPRNIIASDSRKKNIIIKLDKVGTLKCIIHDDNVNTSGDNFGSTIKYSDDNLYLLYNNTDESNTNIYIAIISLTGEVIFTQQNNIINTIGNNLSLSFCIDQYKNIYLVHETNTNRTNTEVTEVSQIAISKISPFQKIQNLEQISYSTTITPQTAEHIETYTFPIEFEYAPIVMPSIQTNDTIFGTTRVINVSTTGTNINVNMDLDRDDSTGTTPRLLSDGKTVIFQDSFILYKRSFVSGEWSGMSAESITSTGILASDPNTEILLNYYDGSARIGSPREDKDVSLELVGNFTDNCSILSIDENNTVCVFYEPTSKILTSVLVNNWTTITKNTINIAGFGKNCKILFNENENKYHIYAIKSGLSRIKGTLSGSTFTWTSDRVFNIFDAVSFDIILVGENYYICCSTSTITKIVAIEKIDGKTKTFSTQVSALPATYIKMKKSGDNICVAFCQNNLLKYARYTISNKNISMMTIDTIPSQYVDMISFDGVDDNETALTYKKNNIIKYVIIQINDTSATPQSVGKYIPISYKLNMFIIGQI